MTVLAWIVTVAILLFLTLAMIGGFFFLATMNRRGDTFIEPDEKSKL